MDEDGLEGLFRPIVASIGLYSRGLKRDEMDRPDNFSADFLCVRQRQPALHDPADSWC